MKKLLLLACFLAVKSISLGQGVPPRDYLLILPDNTSYTLPVKLDGNVIPMGLYCDSLTSNTNVTIQVSYGNVAGPVWYNVATLGGTSTYTVPFTASTLVPLNPQTTSAVIGKFNSDTPWLWVRLVVGTKQTYDKIIHLLARYYY